jgi:predicted small metal-binding protein
MRALDCECGEHLEAADDLALTRKVQEHIRQAHPDMQADEGQVEQLISERAYSSGPQGGGEGIDMRGPTGA